MQWDGKDVIYNAKVKENRELYVTSESLAIVTKHEGDFYQMDIKLIRCAQPSGEVVKLFWRRPGYFDNQPEARWVEGKLELQLDLKKMYPNRKERKVAKKTEANHLAMLIHKTVQQAHTMNIPITNDYLAMHTGEHLVKKYASLSKWGAGNIYITNMGVYFASDEIGLLFNMPFEHINGATLDTVYIKLYFLKTIWVNPQSNIETDMLTIGVTGDKFTEAYEIISKILEKKKEKNLQPPNNQSYDSSTTIQNPLDILKMKLVNDEITEEEYERKKKILSD